MEAGWHTHSSAEAGWVSFLRKGRLSYSFQSSGWVEAGWHTLSLSHLIQSTGRLTKSFQEGRLTYPFLCGGRLDISFHVKAGYILADKDIPTWRQADIPIPLQRQAGHLFSRKGRLSWLTKTFPHGGRLTYPFLCRGRLGFQSHVKAGCHTHFHKSYLFSSRGRLTQLVLGRFWLFYTTHGEAHSGIWLMFSLMKWWAIKTDMGWAPAS